MNDSNMDNSYVREVKSRGAAITIRRIFSKNVTSKKDYEVFFFGNLIGHIVYHPGIQYSQNKMGYTSVDLPKRTGVGVGSWPMMGRHSLAFIKREIVSLNREWASKPPV